MPVYLVTDRATDVRTMVEASRPAGALSALIDNRFDVSGALDATDALKLMSQGVVYLAGAEGDPVPAEEPDFSEVPNADTPERPSLESFVSAADADPFFDDEDAPDSDEIEEFVEVGE